MLPKGFKTIVILGFVVAGLLMGTDFADAGLIVRAPMYIGLNSGLVGYWSFNGQDIAGVTAYDRSGQGNHGTLTNGPKPAIGHLGQALEFDGVDDFVDTGSSIVSAYPVSMCAWINYRSDAVAPMIVRSSAIDFSIINNAGHADSISLFNGNDIISSGSDSIRSDAWNQVCFTVSGSNDANLYINGVVAATPKNIGSPGAFNTIRIGSFNGTSQFFLGNMDDIRFYDRTLSPTEINRLYKIGATAKFNVTNSVGSLSAGLIGHWSFDGKHMGSTSVYDISGNDNTGWLVNGVRKAIGRIGQALEFDGSNDYVDVPDLNWQGNLPVTVSFWNSVAAGNVQNASAFGTEQNSQDLGGNGRLQAHVPYGDNVLYWDYGDTVGDGRISINYSNYLDKWTHVALTSEGSGGNFKAIYLNGVLVQSSNVSDGPTGAASEFHIGHFAASSVGTNQHNGRIDDFRIYDRVLSQNDINRLYKIGATAKFNVTNSVGSLSAGLIGHWSFDGNSMGTTSAYDSSGNDNTGWLVNGPKKTIGRIGQGIFFDGTTDQRIRIPSSFVYDSAGTWSAWIKTDGTWDTDGDSSTDSAVVVSRHDTVSSKSGIFLSINGVTGSIAGQAKDSDGTVLCSYSGSIDRRDNEWHHLTLVFSQTSGQSTKAYLNGVEEASCVNSGSWSFASQDIYVGDSEDTWWEEFKGLIDDVRIYNRALTHDEIRRLYYMGR